MPKIAYEIGIDPQRKVTKEWIQEKLNAAKALMQGRIDEENLCADNPEQLMKTIKDRPSEVVAYDNCMKFFTQNYLANPVTQLFAALVEMSKASPDIAVIGGTLDSEIVSTYSTEDSKATGDDVQLSYTDNKIKDMEIPANYSPMTFGELADLMIANNFQTKEIQLDEDTGELTLVNKTVSDTAKKKYILDEVLNKAASDYAIAYGYTVNWSKTKVNVNYYVNSDDSASGWGADVYAPVLFPEFGLPEVKFEEEKNNVKITETIQFFKSLGKVKNNYNAAEDYKYIKSDGATTVRLIPEILCKVV